MDYVLAGFIGCFLFWALGIVKFPVAFSGFANDTAWFLFGALLIGVIATVRAWRAALPIRSCSASASPIRDSARVDRDRFPADFCRSLRSRAW